MRTIIARNLYIFHPTFHCGLYCRAVYDAEWLVFHDSFFHPKFINIFKPETPLFQINFF